MSQGGYAEIVGFVAREPSLKQISGGPVVANLRVGATTRFLDKTTGEWRDSDTSYFTVICWRKLAHNADLSLRKVMTNILTIHLPVPVPVIKTIPRWRGLNLASAARGNGQHGF